jgi:hypothetical protein
MDEQVALSTLEAVKEYIVVRWGDRIQHSSFQRIMLVAYNFS